MASYARFSKIKGDSGGISDGQTDIADFESKLTENTAAVIVQNPNFFGAIEEIQKIAELAHKNGFIGYCEL